MLPAASPRPRRPLSAPSRASVAQRLPEATAPWAIFLMDQPLRSSMTAGRDTALPCSPGSMRNVSLSLPVLGALR